MTQTTEGVGSGAVPNIIPQILNGVVKSSNIAPSNVTPSDIQDGAVTSAKIATGAVTLDKLATGIVANVLGGLTPEGTIITVGQIKVKVDFTTTPDTCTLKISSNQDFSPLTLSIAYKKITTSALTSGVINQIAYSNTWYTINSVNSDGEMIEAFVTDKSYHSNYRITMQVRQSDYGYTHLVVEHLVPAELE